MPSNTDIVNRSLQAFGSRTTVTDAEMAALSTNEAIQANLILSSTRDELLRMAPWDCAFFGVNLIYVTSLPGTPENSSPATQLWTPGQPLPPWSYEYQYPVDCLRACYIIPAMNTGYAGGVPITTAVTGFSPTSFGWAPVRFKVQTDKFYPVTAAAVANGGTGYAVGDLITLIGDTAGDVPKGAPVILRVATVAAGVILTATVVNQIAGSATPQGGSYFGIQTNPVAQGSTTGAGIGATFTLTQSATKGLQRVIMCNQEFATLAYITQVTDLNVMDPLFIEAYVQAVGAKLNIALSGDLALSNMCFQRANAQIMEARKADANEGLTILDHVPDWIRARGVAFGPGYGGPYNQGFDWGPLYGGF